MDAVAHLIYYLIIQFLFRSVYADASICGEYHPQSYIPPTRKKKSPSLCVCVYLFNRSAQYSPPCLFRSGFQICSNATLVHNALFSPVVFSNNSIIEFPTF